MAESNQPPDAPPGSLPPLSRDASFWGMTATQFLGAFNDNLFKQLVLLLCVDVVASGGGDLQFVATALFSIPFVLLSGFAGWLADRNSKRRIVVLCKLAEIAVMLAGVAAFWFGRHDPRAQLTFALIVLALMGTQSAFFGPSKYGILPELFHKQDLPRVNGAVQMTTFVAIIFGMALAGFTKDWFAGALWLVSAICVGIALAGTATSLVIRPTPVAHPRLPLKPSSLAIHRETWRMLRADKMLMAVLLISSLFWFLGGVVQQAVNAFGKQQMGVGDSRTSLMAACMGVGIAAGCILAGVLSRKRISFRLVRCGGWGVALCLAGLAWLGAGVDVPTDASPVAAEPLVDLLAAKSSDELLARLLLTGAGLFAGLFIVPLQVFMQARPPEDQTGRMIGAMNLINWIGIVFSAVFYAAATTLLTPAHISWTFAALAAMLLPVALFFRPADEVLP